ncbi:exodeoxyribonuclease III [Staphylococcus chromogenes]|nr:exodeoxyribonuclease III [Staphylococcus chromogenes]
MTLGISTVNVNGIRAAVKVRSEANQGFLGWLRQTESDIVLLQEVRASDKQAREALAPALDEGWHFIGAEAAAKGRAGVGILSRTPLVDVHVGIEGFKDSGRYLQATLAEKDVVVASLYLPSGSADTPKQDEKYLFLDVFADTLARLANEHDRMVIGGDWNICHRREDLKNWKSNQKKSGFLPDERAWMDAVFGVYPDEESQVVTHGEFAGAVDYVPGRERREAATDPQWFDVARRLAPEQTAYTWWTYRGQAFDTNAGWRIDYQAATRAMLDAATIATVDKADAYDLRWSDHSPLNVTYQI